MEIDTLYFIQIVCNSYLVSLVFMTQFITYPTFLHIDKDKFSEYHRKYVNNISFIVAPVMLIELLTLSLIAYFSSEFLIIKSLFLLLVIWLTTFFIMIPSHNRISKSFNKKEIKSLINYNWIRTILWSFKLLVIIFLFYEKF
mgnify:FL=1